MNRTATALLAVFTLVFLAGVAGARAQGDVTAAHTGWWTVAGETDGNPFAHGAGDLSRNTTVRDRFRDTPRWLVSGELSGGGPDELAVLFADGTLEVHGLEKGRLRRLASWSGISPEAPPVVAPSGIGKDEGPGLLCVDDRGRLALYSVEGGQGKDLMTDISSLTFPVLADSAREGETVLFAVGDDGFLKVMDGRGRVSDNRDTRLLPDARLAVGDLNGDGKGEIAAFSRPLDKVKGARLGDDTEAQGLAVFSWDGKSLRLENELRLEGKRFFDALGPLLGDLDKSGRPSVVAPVVEEDGSSAIWSFSWSTKSLRKTAEGPRTRDRKSVWQPLAVTDLGDHDRTVVLAVSGPDEGTGMLEALRPDLASTRAGTADGIVVRVPSSRVQGIAVVGDLGGSGKKELLAPGKDGSSLRLFTFKGNSLGSREVFSGSKPVASNLCPGDFDGDGKLDVAFGLQDGNLLVLTAR